MNIKTRVLRLEQTSGTNEEPLYIGNDFTTEKQDSITRAVFGNREKKVIYRDKGESWDSFEKRVLGLSGGVSWAYFYTDEPGYPHVIQIINADIPAVKHSGGAYVY